MRPWPVRDLVSAGFSSRVHAAFEGRQEQVKGGAPAYLRVHGDVAAGLADDGVGGGQTQPGALLFGGEIRVKDFLQIFRSDAPPGR